MLCDDAFCTAVLRSQNKHGTLVFITRVTEPTVEKHADDNLNIVVFVLIDRLRRPVVARAGNIIIKA